MFYHAVICFIMLFTMQEPQSQDKPLVQYNTPLATQVVLTITTTQTDYYVYEPVKLNITFKNVSDDEIKGYFAPSRELNNTEIYYRRGKEAFQKFSTKRQEKRPYLFVLPRKFKSQDELSGQEILVFNTSLEHYVLDKQGDYEFKIIYFDVTGDPNSKLESNIIKIKVETPPQVEAAILKFYDDSNLALLLQYDRIDEEKALKNSINKAVWLIENYPNSLYTKHLWSPLLWMLSRRIDHNVATIDEKQLFNKLNQLKPVTIE